MMIASCKRFDGWALGFDKVGESSGEREGKFGNVPVHTTIHTQRQVGSQAKLVAQTERETK
jgi:hypothetical protein